MKQQRGFTLIELLVTVTIIAVLMGIGFVSYSNASKASRDSKRMADIEAVRQALALYRSEEGGYPIAINNGYVNMVVQLVSGGYLSNPYPVDPGATTPYHYSYSVGGVYCLCADLENDDKSNSNNVCNMAGSGGYYCATSQ
ncbi:MAG: type II secretion system protein [Pseudomonadales bacterium]|nr:type II secretion system protein [Candidatus Woesebacteria bacterium]MCB9802312.1 type II secretion system protein [Pseudomonadales bacterium]